MFAPHDECRQPGKFDCLADEQIYEMTLDSGAGEGTVEAPTGFFEPIDLSDLVQLEVRLIAHYGGAWLIARESQLGTWWVEVFETEAFRDERLETLRQAYSEWDEGVL
jgi:hypothetical protein